MKEWPGWAKAGAQGTTGSAGAGTLYLVFASKDSESEKQKFFSKGQFIWSINQNAKYLKKYIHAPNVHGVWKKNLLKVGKCIIDSILQCLKLTQHHNQIIHQFKKFFNGLNKDLL